MKKTGTFLNFTSLIIIVLFFELVKLNNWNPEILVYETIPLLVLLISYIKYFGKTGLWRFVHKSLDKLDEREARLIARALNTSYSIFTILILLILIAYAVFNLVISMVLIVAFIYFAHILPAYILSFKINNTTENGS